MLLLDRSQRAIQEIRRTFSQNKGVFVLDVGCGFGETAHLLAQNGYEVTGIDSDQEKILKMKENPMERCSFRVAQAESLPFPDQSFKVILLLDVLEHVIDENEVLKEAFRVLDDEGLLIVTVPYAGFSSFLDPTNLLSTLTNRAKRHKHYSIKEIQKLLSPHFKINLIERRSLGISQFFLIISYPFKKLLHEPNFIKKASKIVGSLEYHIQAGKLSYHLFLSAYKTKRD